MLVSMLLNVLSTITGGASIVSIISGEGSGMGFLGGLMMFLSSAYSLAVFIPSLALSVRRLHDIGKSGWYYLILVAAGVLCIIPLIGWLAALGLGIWYLVMMCTDSQVGDNKYGADPKAEERGAMAA